MKGLVIGLSLLLSASAVSAEEILREFSWTAVSRQGPSPGAEVLPAEGSASFEQLKVQNAQGQPRLVNVLTVERPAISNARYAIIGQVRFDGVEGTGYLEMWNHFPDGGRYFSRTLATMGPMKSLSGSSDWRPFVLPFFNKEGGPPPTRLEVNVALPGRGTVYLGPVRLVQYGPNEDPLAVAGQWWSDQGGGMLGGIAGSILGCLGAMVGWLAATGRARRLALGTLKLMILVGVIALAAGGFALLRSQPYAVYYPLLLLGGLCVVIPAGLFRSIRKRYENIELRRMRAMDAPSRP
jgi:hypothetical protein